MACDPGAIRTEHLADVGPTIPARVCVKKTRKRHAVRKMKVGPSELLCRERLQTAIGCYGPMAAVVNAMVKRRDIDRVMWGSERRAKANLWVKLRNRTMVASNPGHTLCLGNSRAGTYLLALWCPVQSRRESDPGFRTELENLVGSVKGESTSGRAARPKVPMGQQGNVNVIWTPRDSHECVSQSEPRAIRARQGCVRAKMRTTVSWETPNKGGANTPG